MKISEKVVIFDVKKWSFSGISVTKSGLLSGGPPSRSGGQENTTFMKPLKTAKITKIRYFPCFLGPNPIQCRGFGAKVQNVFPKGAREGFFEHLFGLFTTKTGFSGQNGLFPGFSPNWDLRLKQAVLSGDFHKMQQIGENVVRHEYSPGLDTKTSILI